MMIYSQCNHTHKHKNCGLVISPTAIQKTSRFLLSFTVPSLSWGTMRYELKAVQEHRWPEGPSSSMVSGVAGKAGENRGGALFFLPAVLEGCCDLFQDKPQSTGKGESAKHIAQPLS